MKKTAVITSIFMLFFAQQANSTLVMDFQNLDTVVRPNGIERYLILNSDESTKYDIAIKPLDTALRRSDGEVEIPLEYLFINNNREDVYIRYNEYSNLFTGLEMGGIPRQLTAKVKNYGMVPAGNYYLSFEIQAVDSEMQTVADTAVFNLCFNVPVIQEINLNNEIPQITVGTNEAFITNKKITNETSPMITINSNCDWELTVNADNFGDSAGNYYIRTISASSNVSERLQERVLLEPGRDIIIARGKIGTGKTSLIRKLITDVPKHYIFITNGIAEHLGSPEFTSFLLENKDSVFILEDCEQILRKRTDSNFFSSGIANILNMSDGILSDIFNVKFICTFNAEISMIDEALLRKDRCFANYEFKEHCAEKTQKLLHKQGFDIENPQPMTLAEIYNFDGKDYNNKPKRKIGF